MKQRMIDLWNRSESNNSEVESEESGLKNSTPVSMTNSRKKQSK